MTIDLKEMLKAGVHFGHKTSRWAPKMRPYIWGAKNKVHLIDVSKTAFLLEKVGDFVKDTTAAGGMLLFVGTKKSAQDSVKNTAIALGMPYVVHRWIGGTLSNFDQVKKAITRLLHLQDVVKKSASHYKKKEIGTLQKEIMRLEKNIGGIVNLAYPPAVVVVVDAKKEHSAVKEASRLGIPVVALVDTNTDPDGVTFVIPANDDSPKSISYIMTYLEARARDGVVACKENREKDRAEQEAKRLALRKEKEAAREQAHKQVIAEPKKVVSKVEAAPVAEAPKKPQPAASKAPAKAAAPAAKKEDKKDTEAQK